MAKQELADKVFPKQELGNQELDRTRAIFLPDTTDYAPD